MIREINVSTGHGFPRFKVFGFKILPVGGEDEAGFRLGCCRADFQSGQDLRDFTRLGCGNVDIVDLQYPARI